MTKAGEFRRPRFVVSKSIFVLVVGYLLVTIAARIWWGQYAHRQLQAEVDAIHARGEPVVVGEVQFKRVPAEVNAFKQYDAGILFLNDSGASIMGYDPLESADLLVKYPAYRKVHPAEVNEFLAKAQPGLEILHRAASMDGEAPTRSDVVGEEGVSGDRVLGLWPELGKYRQFSKLGIAAALAAHERGDDAAAIGYLQDAMHIGDLAGEHRSLIGNLVSIAVTGLVSAALEEITPTLRIGNGAGAVSADQVRALANRLLDTQRLMDSARHGLQTERVCGYEDVMGLRGGYVWCLSDNSWVEFLAMSPARRLNAAEILRKETVYLEDLEGRKLNTVAPRDLERMTAVQQAAMVPYLIFEPSLSRYTTLVRRGIASQEMAGLALLMRLYEVEKGRPVESLANLVPAYIKSLPADPFSATGASPVYLPNTKYPRLYCLDMNRKDDGGDFSRKEYGGRVTFHDPPDWVFFLKGQRAEAEGRLDEQPPRPDERPTLRDELARGMKDAMTEASSQPASQPSTSSQPAAPTSAP